MLRLKSCLLTGFTAGAAALVAACSTEPTNNQNNQAQTAATATGDLTPLSLSQASSEMTQNGLRIEVRVQPDHTPLVATEIALVRPEMARDVEQVQANIVAMDQTDGGGTVTTDLGALKVSFDGNTMFSLDGSLGALSSADFVNAVKTALGNGRHPHLVARRAAPDTPQDPANGLFLADQIQVGANSDQLTIHLNVGRGSLELNTNPPPDAFLKLLGLTIEIRVSEGITRFGRRLEEPGRSVEFAGPVTAVNLTRHTFQLGGSGIIVVVTDKTYIEGGDRLATLDQVAAAIAGGAQIVAAGKATITSLEPRVLTAVAVRFEARPKVGEFRDAVKAVDVANRKLTLMGGSVLCLNDASVIDPAGDLTTLAAVSDALAGGKLVLAAGAATPAGEGSGCRALILKVRFAVAPPPPPPVVEFREGVKSVDLTGRKLTLTNGVVLCVDDHTVISPDGDFTSLDAVAAALAEGKLVGAAGAATPAPEGSGCRALVLKVLFSLRLPLPPPLLEFTDAVKSVDVDGHKLTLASGVTLCLDDQTVISADGDFKTLAEVAAALANQTGVRARGVVAPTLEAAGCRGLVKKVEFDKQI